MHADPAEVKKTIRMYLMVGAALFAFTVITVAANQVHFAVPLAITVAVVIASIKGSMVAAVFMHLSHEKRWIYGSLILTAAFFLLLMLLPLLTVGDTIGRSTQAPTASHGQAAGAPAEHEH